LTVSPAVAASDHGGPVQVQLLVTAKWYTCCLIMVYIKVGTDDHRDHSRPKPLPLADLVKSPNRDSQLCLSKSLAQDHRTLLISPGLEVTPSQPFQVIDMYDHTSLIATRRVDIQICLSGAHVHRHQNTGRKPTVSLLFFILSKETLPESQSRLHSRMRSFVLEGPLHAVELWDSFGNLRSIDQLRNKSNISNPSVVSTR